MPPKVGARKNGKFRAVSTAPSFNKTPMGPSTPPVPYPVHQDLSCSVGTVSTVNFNSDPAYVLNQSTQPMCTGDAPGTALGVKSNTVSGEVKPTQGSSTVRAGGKPVVRELDPCTMNGGNCPGVYITQPAPGGSIESGNITGDTNPPLTAETPAEQSWFEKWWSKTKYNVGQAVQHPGEALIGVAKDVGNIPSHLGELLMQGAAMQGAADLEQAAAMQNLIGQAEQAKALSNTAEAMREGAGGIELPKFEMSNPAQEGGATISTAVQMAAGGVGLIKSGAKVLPGLAKGVSSEATLLKGAATTEQGLASVADEATEAIDAAKAVQKGTKAGEVAEGEKVASAGTDGVIVKKLSPFEELVERRRKLGLPPAGSAKDISTLSRLEMNGQSFDGINSSLQAPKTKITLERVNANTRTHAEADAVQKAVDAGMRGTASKAEMWVDKPLCDACGKNGGMRSLARNLGVDEFVVHTPNGTQIFKPTK